MPTKGGKAKKGAGTRTASRGKGNRQNNPRAFKAASGPKSMMRSAHRAMEKQERQYHVNLQDRSVEAAIAPPIVVAVVGPAGVGKSTLIRSLVKHWTKQNLKETHGPITVVTGKSRRVTLVECPTDLNAMCDLAKIADLVLLVVDGAFGFEMETFEFLNMCQVPRCGLRRV
jgi:ribosome biogenesis protein BMS1